jgi:transcriptional regulator with XRE-family HTH domain
MSTKKAGKKNMAKDFQDILAQAKSSEMYDKEVLRGEISDQIACLMQAANVSRAELARRLGKSPAYITKILQGNANFTLDSLVQIARVLGCKYAPIFVPVNVWKEIEVKALNLTPQRLGESKLKAETYKPNDPNASQSTT